MLKRLIIYLLIVFLGFVLLYPKFPLFNVAGTYVAIRLEDILTALLLFIWILWALKDYKKIISQKVTKSFLLFWAIGLLSLLSAMLITYSVKPHLGILHWLRRVELMSLFFVAATTLSNIKQLKFFLIFMAVITVIVSVYGFGQVYLHFPVISTTNSEFSKGQILELTTGARPNSTFAGHYDLAVFLSMAIIFSGILFFYYKKYWQKVLIFVVGFLGAGLLGLTAARASFAATFVGLTVAFWITGKRLLIAGLIAASLIIVIVSPDLRHRLVATITVNLLEGGGAKYAPPSNLPKPSGSNQPFSVELQYASSAASGSAKLPRDIVPGEPINTTELGVERSFNIRTNIEWPRAIMAWEKNPLLGTGYASLSDQKGNSLATDNDFLRSLGETGLLGTLALAGCFWIILKRVWRGWRSKTGVEKLFLLCVLCSTLAVFLTGTVIDVFEASKIATLLWIMLGLAWAVSGDYKYV